MKKKGVLLFSGGLDSIIAARLLLDQGIEIIPVSFVLPFVAPDADPWDNPSMQPAKDMGLDIRFIRCGLEYMKMVESPKFGYGKNINPCLDCKIFFLKKAAEIMREEKASFVATGEVLGQRPMSQQRGSLRKLERESGLEGFLLRPLSAQLMEPTVAELKGIVDREKLLRISGRSRKEQMALATKWGIKDYSPPGGGCLFTDPSTANRVRDFLEYQKDYQISDIYLLTIGRHFRFSEKVKCIIGRNHQENIELEKYSANGILLIPDFKGPTVLLQGDCSEDDIDTAIAMIYRYNNKPTDNLNVEVKSPEKTYLATSDFKISEEKIQKMQIR